MIVWKGRGILAFIIGFGTMIIVNLVADGWGGHGYYEAHGWLMFLSGVIAAVPIWILGTKWNEESGGQDTLFFIPMQYWAIGVLLLGVVAAGTSSGSVTSKPAEPPPRPTSEPQRTADPVNPEPAPLVQASAVAVPPPQAEVQRKPVPAGKPEISQPVVVRVFADNDSRQYFPENCPGRPEKAYLISRTVARAQGFTLAAGCSE